MAKFCYIYSPKRNFIQKSKERVADILPSFGERILMDGKDQLLYVNNKNGVQHEKFNLKLGSFKPEFFSFQLSADQNKIIAKSDLTASRTVWYYSDNNSLIISDSQRAIIALLGDFQLNKQAVSWMLLSGCLGPGNSWDKRIKHLPPSTTLEYNKHTQSLNLLKYSSKNDNSSDLKSILSDIFKNFNSENAAITLSGGYDSRTSAFYLRKFNHQIPAYTWGIENSEKIVGTDSNIALKVAKSLKIDIQLLTLRPPENPEKKLFEFVEKSEGRIDHISSFIYDGNFWQNISQSGIEAIIRSDEAFGWLKSKTEREARISLDYHNLSDYKNLNELFDLTELPKPEYPRELVRLPDESVPTWRDRVYRNYRIPFVLSSLQEPILPYMEIFNPLLAEPLIKWAQNRTDSERSDKNTYKELAGKLLPEIQIADIPSIPEPGKLARHPGMYKVIYNYIELNDTKIFPQKFKEHLLQNFKEIEDLSLESRNSRLIKSIIPFWLKKVLRSKFLPYQLDYGRLALRVFIILKMQEIIEDDLKK